MKLEIKAIAYSLVLAVVAVGIVWGAENVRLQRITQGIAGQGNSPGSYSITNFHAYVVSESPTNEYIISTVSLNGKVGTAVTNINDPAYIAAPTIVLVPKTGASAAYMTNFAFATVSYNDTITNIVSGLNGTTFTNLSMIVYGYKRTAVVP